MKRPLIPVALLYVAGILLAAIPIPVTALFAIAFALALLCLVWGAARRILLCGLLVMTGWVNLAHRTAILSPNDLRAQFGGNDAFVTLRGVLCETPYHRVREAKDMEVWTTTANIDVSAIRPDGGDWQAGIGRVVLHAREFLPDDYFAGETIEVTGVLRPASGPAAEGLFDYRSYLDHQGIHYELRPNQLTDWRIVSPTARPLADRFCAWARKSLALGLPVEDESLRLEWALTLGWKAALTDKVSEPFIKAATYHIFAVDGLRIAIITGILLALMKALGVTRRWCGVLIVPVLLFYAAMTGWPASAIRAIVMIFVVFGGWVLKRPHDFLSSLFAAALIILVWEPRELFQAGFQLSFIVVLCIILIIPAFEHLGELLLRPDPLRPESLQPGWQKALRWVAWPIMDLFVASLAAWLGSIPLVAWYFHLITPLSGPANVLAVPLCALVLICNLTSLALTAWLPSVAIIYNHAGWFCMEGIRVTSNWSAQWPGAYYYVPMPGLFTICLYYLILITTLTGWLFQGARWKWKISGVGLLVAIWCGGELWQFPVSRLTILPLEGGHSVYVKPAGFGNDWLIDCGDDSAIDFTVKPFLEAQGVNRLSNFVVTHGEAGYSGGAESIGQLFEPRNIYLSPIHFRSPNYRAFQAAEKDQPTLRPPIKRGDHIGPWQVLYPPPESAFTRAEDNALVLRGEFNGVRVLLLSDLSHAGQNALLNLGGDLHADIVVAGLPGDGEPLGDALLNAIQPSAIVCADSQFPANKKAGYRLKQRLEHRNVPIFYTSICNAVTLSVRPGRWELRAMDGTKFSGVISSTAKH